MSAITLVNKEIGPDGVRRYHTRWKVLVQSHQYRDTTDLSNSIINLQSSKNAKSVGTLSMSFTGERNLLNLVYPDDYINVYCDRGDGQGWTRVFFGFVDHIEESRAVEASTGKPTTGYALQCSDFQKAFDRTEIYFNPYVAARSDFSSGAFASRNIGGAALRIRGLRVSGTPSDMVINTVLLLLGFGAQFLLPESFSPQNRDRIRAQRAEFILGRVSEDVRNQILQVNGYAAYLENIKNSLGISSPLDTLVDPERGYTLPDGTAPSPDDLLRFQQQAAAALGAGSTATNFTGQEAFNVLNTTMANYSPTLLDVVDIFTFVERAAIDGYTTQLSLWDKQQSVMSFMRGISNEIVNEMFLDLRPISRDGGLTAGSDYSREPDDVNGNISVDTSVQGIQYAPSIVMREYPFSTINTIDASQVPITITGQTQDGEQGIHIGALQFGAIFSDKPNIPGRHVITIDNINSEDRVLGRSNGAPANKHIDVAVVHDSEITTSSLSRSDTDHFNLFELISESSLLGESTKFFMMDLLPIITPVHIMRHGLRTRRLNTRFARFSLATVAHTQQQEVDRAIEDTSPELDDIAPSNATYLPVELVSDGAGHYTQGHVISRWLYRSKSFDGARPINNKAGNPVPANHTSYWRFHNGVDLAGTEGTPIRAVRDGVVVMAAPQGTRGTKGYGNCIMLYHEADGLYTFYAHLHTISDSIKSTARGTGLAFHSSRRINGAGRYVEKPVRAGDVIGTMGNTDCPNSVIHLHFEFALQRPGIPPYPSSTDRDRGISPDYFMNPGAVTVTGDPITGYPVSSSRPSSPPETRTMSQDPVRIFADKFGMTLPGVTVSADDVDSLPGDEGEAATSLPAVRVSPQANTPAAVPGSENQGAGPAGAVDTPDTRRLLARWALLNDHWYQHNLEYVSGTIAMRGAPEIRVGYRLDLPDRNMSFYVENVSHNWAYSQPMTTTLHVTRGQPNNPFPAYVAPFLQGFAPSNTQRQVGSRLASFFVVPDPLSVARSLKFQGDRGSYVDLAAARRGADTNTTDSPGEHGTVGERYQETIIPADTGVIDRDFTARMARAEEVALSVPGAGASTSSGAVGVPSDNGLAGYLEDLRPLEDLDIVSMVRP